MATPIKPRTLSFRLTSSHWIWGAKFVISLTVMVMLTGCAAVHVHNAKIATDSRLGIITLKIAPDAQGAALIITEGVGLTFGGHSTVLGYINETMFLASGATRCGLFILAQRTAEFEAIQSLLLRNGMNPENVCLMTKGER